MIREQWREAAVEIARRVGLDREHVPVVPGGVLLNERAVRALLAALPAPRAPAAGPPAVPWEIAGGPNECRHGYAEGIPCERCAGAATG